MEVHVQNPTAGFARPAPRGESAVCAKPGGPGRLITPAVPVGRFSPMLCRAASRYSASGCRSLSSAAATSAGKKMNTSPSTLTRRVCGFAHRGHSYFAASPSTRRRRGPSIRRSQHGLLSRDRRALSSRCRPRTRAASGRAWKRRAPRRLPCHQELTQTAWQQEVTSRQISNSAEETVVAHNRCYR
jgi:hypothetical protein